MMLNDITTAAGAHKRRKRVGRGESSGHGKTSGRGTKGAQSRGGFSTRPLTEGGQMPVFRRLPKRGFSNFHFRTEYVVVNLADLEQGFEGGAKVDVAALRKAGLVRGAGASVKVLGDGVLTKKLALEVHAVSEKARQAIEKAGGTLTLLARPDSAALAKAKRNTRKATRQSKPASPGKTARAKTPEGKAPESPTS
jgi:large subunit ribosomal protein L15